MVDQNHPVFLRVRLDRLKALGHGLVIRADAVKEIRFQNL
jgi:hypothetical protein